MSHAGVTYRIMGACLVLGAMGCSAASSEEDPTIPENIRGVWVTDDPEYADQKLELLETAVYFYTEQEDYEPYVVKGVEVVEEEVGTTYLIHHSGWEGGEMILSLMVRPGDTTLVFKNQPDRVWRWVPENR